MIESDEDYRKRIIDHLKALRCRGKQTSMVIRWLNNLTGDDPVRPLGRVLDLQGKIYNIPRLENSAERAITPSVCVDI